MANVALYEIVPLWLFAAAEHSGKEYELEKEMRVFFIIYGLGMLGLHFL